MIGKLTRISRFSRQKGNIIMLAAFAFIPIALLISGSIALMRWNNMQSNVQQALDSATILAAKIYTFKGSGLVVSARQGRSFFKGETQKNKLFSCDPVIFAFNRSGVTSASVECNVTGVSGIAGLVGKNTKYTFKSKAAFKFDKYSIILVLDNSGSMKRNSRMVALKAGVENFVKTLSNTAKTHKIPIKFGIVPFSTYINLAGTGIRFDIIGRRDLIGGQGPITCVTHNYISYCSATAKSPSTCVGHRSGPGKFSNARALKDPTKIRPPNYKPPANYKPPPPYRGPKSFHPQDCRIPSILPLTSNINNLKSTINKMRPDGMTGGHVGLQWARYLLKPGGISSKITGSPRGHKNYIIFMTDGHLADNDNSNTFLPYALKHCDLIKRNKEATIITIGYSVPKRGENFIKNCASKPEYALFAGSVHGIEKLFNNLTSNFGSFGLIE